MNEDGGESTEPDNNDKTLFFGSQNQINDTPTNFTVNAIDADELRRSQRKPRPTDLGQNPSNPSQESDFDEDDDGLSTPTAEKSMTSMMSVSSENVDRVSHTTHIVWKFHNFSMTHILREINFWDSKRSETVFSVIFVGFEFC